MVERSLFRGGSPFIECGKEGGKKIGQYIFGINSGGSYFSYHNAVKVLPLIIEFHFYMLYGDFAKNIPMVEIEGLNDV